VRQLVEMMENLDIPGRFQILLARLDMIKIKVL
jgi:hypothetical protein